jgi:hypothetical protein
MPILNVGDRLTTPHGRIDLAREVIGVMFHPESISARRRWQSALAMTLLGMRDKDDEPEALQQANTWFKRAGSFKTASQADPYTKQQQAVLRQVPGIVAVGTLLNLAWVLDTHHRDQIAGGASLNKAVALYAEFPYLAPMASRTLWKQWDRYKSVAHFCAAFTLVFDEARRQEASEMDERMKRGFDEELDGTLGVVAAYQRFGTTFSPRATEGTLIDLNGAWLLRGIEPDAYFSPPPLPPDMLTFIKRYRAPVNSAYR